MDQIVICLLVVKKFKKLVEHSSTEKCTENIDEGKITRMTLFEHESECACSFTICVVLAMV